MSTLNELVARYGKNNAEMNRYKKLCEPDNAEIKSIMGTTGVHECTAGGFTAKYTVSKSESFDEEKLTETFKTLKINDEQFASDIPGLIEYKPVINMDVLENAIYDGRIAPAALAGCKTTKETVKLTVSRVKEKK